MTALLRARMLPASLALLFTWAYGFWLPLHLIAEPHHASLGQEAHSHVHGRRGREHRGRGHHGHAHHGHRHHGHEQPAEEHHGDEASFHPVEHEHLAYAHEHPSLRTATKTPYVTVFMQTIGSEVKAPEVTTRFVPTYGHDPPKLHDHFQACARAPPRSTFSPSVCG